MTASVLRLLLLATAFATAPGCGTGRPKTYPVSGRVVFPNGRPFTGGVVEFVPADASGAGARGAIQPDGTFRLTTFRENDGAVEGRHRAVVVWSPPPASVDNEKAPARCPLHPKFQDPGRSGLAFDVTPAANEFTITVTGP